MKEQRKPSPIQLTERDIFLNGTSSLTPTGSSIQFIRDELNFLHELWRGRGDVSKGRENEIILGIAERFAEVSDELGISSDMDLIPDVVEQYNKISYRRVYDPNALSLRELEKTPA